MESYLGQQQLSPPGTYPIPNTVATNEEDITFVSYSLQSTEEKKELLLVARNSLDILSSILNSDTEPKPIQDDLTVTMLEKCKQSLPVVQRIIESTSDDKIMLFDALNLHDELQLAIPRHDELVAASASAQSKGQTTQEVSAESKTDEATWQNETIDHSITGSHESHNSSHQEDGADKKQQS